MLTKRTDVLPQDLVKYQSREVRVEIIPIALTYGRHLDSSATEIPVKFQSQTIIITSNLAASRLHKISREDAFPLDG